MVILSVPIDIAAGGGKAQLTSQCNKGYAKGICVANHVQLYISHTRELEAQKKALSRQVPLQSKM